MCGHCSYCSADIELCVIKCRPFYQPCEFICTIITAVYDPLDANAKLSMKELCAAISKLQTAHLDGAFIVAGNFSHDNLRTVENYPNQNVSCPMRGDKPLDHGSPKLLKHTEPFLSPPCANWSTASTPQIHLHHQTYEALSEDCRSVDRGSRLFTIAPVPVHRVEHVCFLGHPRLPHWHFYLHQFCSRPYQQVYQHSQYLYWRHKMLLLGLATGKPTSYPGLTWEGEWWKPNMSMNCG